MDINGTVVLRRNETLMEGDNIIKVNGELLPNGVYYLTAKVDGINSVTKKLVKIK